MSRVPVVQIGMTLAAVLCLAGCSATPEATTVENITAGATVSASAFENVAAGGWKDFPPDKTLDKDLAVLSSWRAEAEDEHHGQWIKYDLGSIVTVAYLKIAFLQGESRIYSFDIALSEDDRNWTKVFSGQSEGKTAGFELFDFDDRPARYVRLTGYGNRAVEGPNKFPRWFNILETEIYGY